jgi:hypothetical protein
MKVDFCDNISAQEQQAIMCWLKNSKLPSSQIVKINGIDYNVIVIFEGTLIAAVRVIK